MRLIFSEIAFKQLSKLASDIQKRINDKLDFYIAQKNPLDFAEKLNDNDFRKSTKLSDGISYIGDFLYLWTSLL